MGLLSSLFTFGTGFSVGVYMTQQYPDQVPQMSNWYSYIAKEVR